MPAALEKALPTLGHAIVTWARATGDLLNQVERGLDKSGWLLARWDDLQRERPTDLPPGTSFVITLHHTTDQWWIHGCREIEPNAWSLMRWLLHLPGLSERWVGALRAERFERLRLCVPTLWYVDDVEPPAGSVIAGLDAASWRALTGQHGLGADLVQETERWVSRRRLAEGSVNAGYEISAEDRVTFTGVVR